MDGTAVKHALVVREPKDDSKVNRRKQEDF
jgi:hypothetical protein